MSTIALDPDQRAFASAASTANIRLLAPAGCGKTLCLLARCKHLAETLSPSAAPPRFLFVTFTRAATEELRARLYEDPQFHALRQAHVQHPAGLLDIATLNAWGYRRIRNATFSPKLLTDKTGHHFAVLNQLQPVWKRHSAIKTAIEAGRNRVPRRLMDVIDAFKSLGFDHCRHLNLDDFSRHIDSLHEQHLAWRLQDQLHELALLGILSTKYKKGGDETPRTSKTELYRVFFQFWRDATDHLIESATFTFEDQKYFAYLHERSKAEEGSYLSGAAAYSHILIDEFQDVNPLDLHLVKAIAIRNRATITIAGDDDQAIFEWRGASPEYILQPESFLGRPFETHTLGVNYRSPENVVRHAQQLIEHNTRRVAKPTRSSGVAPAKIEILETEDLVDALRHVYAIVRHAVSRETGRNQVAIIGRKRSQLIPYQVFFAAEDVPFCAAEDLQIFLSDTFDRLLDLLRIKTRSGFNVGAGQATEDALALCRFVMRYPLSKKDQNALRQHFRVARPTSLGATIEALRAYEGPLKGKNANGVVNHAMADSLSSFVRAETVSETLLALGEHFSGLQSDFGKAEDDIFFLDPPFAFLAEYAESQGDDYDAFVEAIERAKEKLVYVPPFQDQEEGTIAEIWSRPVHLMTAQRAKGKQFNTVVLLDVVEGIWPIVRPEQTWQQLEAERRIFYVAFTRAKNEIVLQVTNPFRGEERMLSRYVEEMGLET
ncbi:UvrD-helicase domain-containing protein [Candidatus Palauibacter sp.]|uniref:UvrD-helicase domain-containing protein n=1 Tax=Candidatus Palauibacter sp. TaxID=3101350 RepID=UPI003B519C54